MSNTNQKLGSELHPKDQAYVLAAYVHRFTREHIPEWAKRLSPNGKPYPLHFESDKDWLDHTYFTVHNNGDLDRRTKNCSSNPTWPDNPELQKQNQ